ncbi:DUF3347 domain-containing protein [Chitinophaga sp.]|uniref:DUF3347 domain-containing protein n=1 Tax=Chitinophaga sp. TaxID=1869181 RepID=UPI0031CDB3E3
MAVACNQGSQHANGEADQATRNEEGSKPASAVPASGFSIAPIVKSYLALKNALAAGNDVAAANAGKELLGNFNSVDMAAIPADKHKAYMDIVDDAKVNAEHISANAGKIEHQREHFAVLSNEVNDLVQLFNAPQKLYLDSCPMYDNGKGAIWLSETSEIKNPYFGGKMSTCGSVKKEY